MRVVVATLLATALSACSPVMESYKTYQEPMDFEVRQCIIGAREIRDDCLENSRLQWNSCMASQRLQAQSTLETMMTDYNTRASEYRSCAAEQRENVADEIKRDRDRAMREYEQANKSYASCDASFQRELTKLRSKPQLERPVWVGSPMLESVERSRLCGIPPQRPEPVQTANALNQQVLAVCGALPNPPRLEDFIDADACGEPEASCQMNFDADFELCGGTIERGERCVKHCD